MKILILVILIPFFSFSQLKVKMQKREYNVKDDIVLNIKNDDTINRFLNVQLEKYDSKKQSWKLYSKDVFSKSFTMPLELTLISEKGKILDLKFKIDQPELLDSPKYTKKKNEFIREEAKKGKFRVKVFNGYDELNKNEITYSDSFIAK